MPKRRSVRPRISGTATANGFVRDEQDLCETAAHEKLGLSTQRLQDMFETMLLARAIDERQWILNRQGREPFHISCQGHEGSGVGSAFALDLDRDVMVPYYRSLAAVLAFGVTPLDVFLSALAKADDPMTGGRQMPAHYGLARARILTSGSSVATQIPHATGAAAVGYGMFGCSVDGTDPLAVYAAVKQAADRARAGEGPTLIESNVVRLTPHSSDDDDRRYRPEAEREEARHHDPIDVFRTYLSSHGLLDEAADFEMRERVQTSVESALEEAEAAAPPSPETAFDHVYAGVRMPNFRDRLR